MSMAALQHSGHDGVRARVTSGWISSPRKNTQYATLQHPAAQRRSLCILKPERTDTSRANASVDRTEAPHKCILGMKTRARCFGWGVAGGLEWRGGREGGRKGGRGTGSEVRCRRPLLRLGGAASNVFRLCGAAFSPPFRLALLPAGERRKEDPK